MIIPRIFRREPRSLKGIKERSAVAESAELSLLPAFRAPVTGEQARAAMERSRARRAANGSL
jgi:hypothetical protein